MPAGLLQGAFSEEDYGRRRMKLITEKDSLIVPDDARTLELGRQLEKIRRLLGIKYIVGSETKVRKNTPFCLYGAA